MPLLAAALVSGGLPIAEVTLRRPGSVRALRALADHDVLVGAGTVMTPSQADEAVRAGARFLVSPGFSPAVAREATRLAVPLIPGVATATELMTVQALGFDTVKFFPAATSGGPQAIRALSAVAPEIRWLPTGGIDASTARNYLDVPEVLAIGGSWMTPRALLAEGRIDEVVTLVRQGKALVA